MNRRIRHRDAFARLALLAALLLALVPTLGRVLAPVSTAPMAHAMHAGPGMAGLHHAVAHGDAMAHHHPAPTHPPFHQHDADCPYCPLLATVLATPMQALALAPSIPPPHVARRFAQSHASARFHGSLGSRGPPPVA